MENKEIKVQLYSSENDDFNELWRVVGEEKYYCRNVWKGFGTWYYVCDPLGYCELDREVPNNVIFVICDDNGNELFRNSNADKSFPTFESIIKSKWKEFSENIPHHTENFESDFWNETFYGETTMKINQWLLSFKDPNLYGEKAKDYDENWTGCWAEKEINYEPITGTEFEYLGKKYQFTKVTHKHDYCGVEWIEFVCTDSPYQMQETPWVKDRQWIQSYGYLGNWFDDSIYGTMFDKRTAREKVIERLLKIFPQKNKDDNLLLLGDSCVGKTVREISYSDAADLLINHDLHVNKVNKLCKYIRKESVNLFQNNRKNRNEIKRLYPNIYQYDLCLWY